MLCVSKDKKLIAIFTADKRRENDETEDSMCPVGGSGAGLRAGNGSAGGDEAGSDGSSSGDGSSTGDGRGHAVRPRHGRCERGGAVLFVGGARGRSNYECIKFARLLLLQDSRRQRRQYRRQPSGLFADGNSYLQLRRPRREQPARD